jgi:hypothetical protein
LHSPEEGITNFFKLQLKYRSERLIPKVTWAERARDRSASLVQGQLRLVALPGWAMSLNWAKGKWGCHPWTTASRGGSGKGNAGIWGNEFQHAFLPIGGLEPAAALQGRPQGRQKLTEASHRLTGQLLHLQLIS